MELALKMRLEKLVVYSDSQLVIKHMNRNYETKELSIVKYLGK